MMENQTKKKQIGDMVETEENTRRKERIGGINKDNNTKLEEVKNVSD